MSLWNGLKKQLEAGIRTGCFVEKFMETDYPQMGISEIEAAYIAGTMIEAGSDSTQNSLNSMILGLTAFPEVVEKAHEELDRVAGDRLPQIDDSPNLPYIRAMMKEVLRWRSVSNDHFAHLTTSDVIYKDYFIPAGTVLVGNTWALHYDPNIYPEPERYNPDRFLGTRTLDLNAGECINAQDVRDRDHWSFGAGRRVCPGYTLAENSLFILTARLLWAFDIKAPIDPESGKRVKPDLWNYPPQQFFQVPTFDVILL
ncbi:uncharacterized protein Z518_11260 [Rhinocladiella mackenziei CBS 650.93]|uniref:Cytochrome P450 n=1 Tax=Rhinocladiella mackenziei CBS 650.93 TaxID=1442369 RepID=A0A0D2FBR9_9EURO|nr:uncharacterized protein Z518_11260 [Rhinocladiella mackenziei CBS 650.93]KIW99521.1 hypothetical protein Z518_11260 [Rhinocladiella mackenziei CBS 650.93]